MSMNLQEPQIQTAIRQPESEIPFGNPIPAHTAFRIAQASAHSCLNLFNEPNLSSLTTNLMFSYNEIQLQLKAPTLSTSGSLHKL